MEDLDRLAQQKFRIPALKSFQRDIIAQFLQPGHQNLLALLPTGSGKTLCFTLPMFLLPGFFLVIFPLKALMQDQLRRFQEAGVPAALLQGGQTRSDRQRLWNSLDENRIKVVAATPEVLIQPRVARRLASWKWEAVILDEAHCLPLWGDAFRPAYLALGPVVQGFRARVLAAFTATAGEDLRLRLQEVFFPSPPRIIQGNPDRENIFYLRWNVLSRFWALVEILQRLPRPLVLFCRTRDQTAQLAAFIHRLNLSFPVGFFHAGLTEPEKHRLQDWFLNSSDGVLCCTKAFGMGIDKKNIRTVVHWEAPDRLEDFLQESGRGGRDGSLCWSVVLGSEAGFPAYLDHPGCYRIPLLEPLGWEGHSCTACGGCVAHALPAAPWFLYAGLDQAHRRWTPRELALVLWGKEIPETKTKGLELNPLWGTGREYSLEILEDLVTQAEKRGLFHTSDRGFFRHTVVKNGQKT